MILENGGGGTGAGGMGDGRFVDVKWGRRAGGQGNLKTEGSDLDGMEVEGR